MSANSQIQTAAAGKSSDGLLMGIDLGSSFFKVEVFDASLHRIGGASAPVVYAGRAACVEMPVADCEKTLREAIAGAIQNSGCAPDDICSTIPVSTGINCKEAIVFLNSFTTADIDNMIVYGRRGTGTDNLGYHPQCGIC